MKTIKLSYTILNAWGSGKWEDAVAMYLGKGIPVTPAMELGSVKHKLWAEYAIKEKKLHKDLGGILLDNPVAEQKYEKVIPFSDDMQILLRGVPDLSDNDIIYEFKCGAGSASSYISSLQLDYYKLLLPEAKKGIMICYNPYLDTHSLAVKFLDQNNVKVALNHLLTLAGEIINYLQSEKMLMDYKYAPRKEVR